MREKAFLERKPFPAFILISQKVVRLWGYSLKTPVFMGLLAPYPRKFFGKNLTKNFHTGVSFG
jgi:hypothetical protein